MQRLRLGNVLQDGVVLDGPGIEGPGIEGTVENHPADQFQQALLLTAEQRSARPGRQEQRFDTEGIAREEQTALDGVPDREGEHAAQATHRVGPPVVEGRDDRLTVALGGENGFLVARELGPDLHVVVDLTVEDQGIPVGCLGRAPAQRLVGVFDVDDGQPVESEDEIVVVPGARFVGPTVAHAVRGR